MRPRAIALVAASGYAVFLVATAPASLLAARVDAATQGQVHMADPRGTIWSGHTRVEITGAAGTSTIERLEWSFAPSALAAGRAAFDVSVASRGLDASARLARGFRDWALERTDVKLDARNVSAWAPMLAAWHPEGRIALSSNGLAWDDEGKATGKARLAWDDAAVSLSEVRPLGRYTLDIAADHGPAAITLATIDGPLKLSGHGSFAPGKFSFSGEARGEGPNASALEPLLNLMGLKRADGSRAIEVGISL
jgi:general secretion pathway protein N